KVLVERAEVDLVAALDGMEEGDGARCDDLGMPFERRPAARRTRGDRIAGDGVAEGTRALAQDRLRLVAQRRLELVVLFHGRCRYRFARQTSTPLVPRHDPCSPEGRRWRLRARRGQAL